MLILRRPDGSVIEPIGSAVHVVFDPKYNEVSTLEFDVPAQVNGQAVPYYKDICGMQIVDYKDVVRFVLMNPVEHKDGIQAYKRCKAYSLEYEFTRKKMYLEYGTYCFWNPVAPDDTVLGIILKTMPSWSVGTVDETLYGKYRTFESNGDNLYNFMKSQLQDTYRCIFDFDTYQRKINVRDVSSTVPTRPVYLSLDNLIKEIEIEEDTENIFTCLDVNGAEDVDIRAVNPMGINKIYNFDYFMTPANFSEATISKYQAWKTAYEAAQLSYYNLTIEKMLQTSNLLTAQSALRDLQGELKSDENLQSVYIDAASDGIDKSADLLAVRTHIASLNGEITAQEGVIASLQSTIADLTAAQVAINTSVAFSAFFDEDELLLIDRYIKEEAITESSFVMPQVKNYNTADYGWNVVNEVVSVSGQVTQVDGVTNAVLYTVKGGSISFTGFQAAIVKSTFERKNDGTFLLTAYLSHGTYGSHSFKSGCLSISGSGGEITASATSASMTLTGAHAYFTENLTEYDKFSVEWDLYEYGCETLEKLAYPSYKFSVESGNFLALDDFVRFKNQLNLGDRVYLDWDNGALPTDHPPVFIGAHIEFDDASTFSLEFNDSYSSADAAGELASLLEQSVSMGKTLDASRFTYSQFVDSGASTSVKDYMDHALDVAKQQIMSSSGQDITWGEEGLRLRQKLQSGDYDDEQVWMVNNKILFTDDGWQTVKGMVGKFEDPNLGSTYGIVLPSLMGTLIASNELIIESAKKDGGVSVFKVDGSGAALHNATFDIYNGSNTQITLNPVSGIAIGSYPLYTGDSYTINTNNAKFWVDTNGNLHLKGTLEAADGTFSGALNAATGTFSGALNAATGTFAGALNAATGTFSGSLNVGGDNAFHVDTSGNMYIGGPAFYSSPFRIDAAGNLFASSATISGTITASDIDVSPTTAQKLSQLMSSGWSYFSGTYITDLNAANITVGSLSADRIGAGTLDCSQIFLTSGYGGFRQGTGSATTSSGGTTTTTGAMMYGGEFSPWATPTNYVITTTGGVRLNAGNTWFSVWNGGCGSSMSGYITSDRRAKHDIKLVSDSDDVYEKFFDALSPSTFVLNIRQDERRDFGFVAQEVENAMRIAGITPNEYSVVSHTMEKDDAQYSLAYTQFIALNTYMIQKLKNKIEVLENEIDRLKGLQDAK